MPHAIFLGSHVTLPRVREFDRKHHPERILKDDNGEDYKWTPSISAIRATLSYSIAELIISLSTFAMFVNCAILIVAGAALYGSKDAQGEDLFSIHALLSTTLAPVAGTLFALGLLFSGQSSSIIATIVGQIICEGFIQWKVRPFIRRGITRLIALIPCVIVASAIGKSGLSMALNISQVPLSPSLFFLFNADDRFRLVFCCRLFRRRCCILLVQRKSCVCLSIQQTRVRSRFRVLLALVIEIRRGRLLRM